jgi:hypothetical protein
MNNYILISKTFTEVTPESAVDGDFSDMGYITEKEAVTFRELVQLMKEHPEPSQSPTDGNTRTWFTCYPYTSDYSTAAERQESIHYHQDNTPNIPKYWKLAYKIANQVKQ